MKATRKPKAPSNWAERFLEVFRNTGNVMRSAKAAGVGRNTVYAKRERDARFRTAMEEAGQDALEVLELEAHRRAVHGTKEPVFYKGERCGHVRRYSDTLLIVLLKARAPEKYRENAQVTHSGTLQQAITVVEVRKEGDGARVNAIGSDRDEVGGVRRFHLVGVHAVRPLGEGLCLVVTALEKGLCFLVALGLAKGFVCVAGG